MPLKSGMLTFEELRSMSEDELTKMIDQQLQLTPDARHLFIAQYYNNEFVRREQDKTTQSMLGYTEKMYDFTRQIKVMTIIITICTVLRRL